MGLRPLFDRTKRRGWLAGLASVVLLLGLTATIHGDLPEDRQDRDRDRGRSLEPATTPTITQFDPNRVIAFLTERGEFGASAGSVAGGGFWRATTDQYIFSSGINVGAVVGADTLVAIGGPFSELGPGSLVTPGLDVFWDTRDPEDRANFPEVCTVDTFRQTILPSLQPFGGEPFPGFADQTVCLAVNDLLGGACSDCAGTRLGMESAQTYFGFGVPAVQDFGFVIYRVFNRSAFVTADNAPSQAPGPFEWTNTTVGVAIDPDVGEAGDDQIAFLPDVRTMVYWDSDFNEPQFQNPPGFGGVTALDVFLSTQAQGGLVPAQDEVGFAEFTVFTNGAPRPDPASKEEWYEGMTGDLGFVILEVTPRDIRGLVTTSLFNLSPGEFVEVYAAFFFAAASGALPGDLRAEAFKDLATGEIIPDANTDPVFDNFKNTQRTAQSVFDAGFIVPTAPPKPEVELIPGDGKVTVAWGNGPVESVNPFAKVARDPFVRLPTGEPDPEAPGVGIIIDADDIVFDVASDQGGTTGFVRAADLGLGGVEATNAAFNPEFVIQDFQAFKVWRSQTGQSDDAELIAIFDISDGNVTDELCVNAQLVLSEGEPFTAVCTETEEFVIGNDTGLNFAVVDRGGTFPNPAAGPGLINGIPVFYSVTSVGVNCGELVVDAPASVIGDLNPPAACLTLEAGIAPMFSAVPRSESSAVVGGELLGIDLLGSDGEVIPQSAINQGSFEVDDDGNLTGAVIPPANGWTANVTPVRPELLPPDFQMFFVIDSMPVAPEFVQGLDWSEDFLGFGVTRSDGINAADTRARVVFVSMRDASGNILNTPSGPATAAIGTGFLTFGGTTPVSTPTFAIVPQGADEVAVTAAFNLTIPRRDNQCGRLLICGLTTDDGVTLPASVSRFHAPVAMYGQVGVRDIEAVWSNQGGNLSFSSVRDISNNIDLPFVANWGSTERGWGFAAPTQIGPGAQAWNDVAGLDIPMTDDGRILWPDPISVIEDAIDCGICALAFAGATQFAPLWWPDLPSSTEAELIDLYAAAGGLNAFPLNPIPPEARHPGVLRESATIATDADGNPFTRVFLSGHEYSITFNNLPADGEVWRFRLRHGVSNTPRPLVPGSRVRIDLPGRTNELADADLGRITVVPNPFIAASEIQRGRGLQRVLFTQLPPRATIRIYTVSGNLVRILEHTDGSGTAEWDVRSRFDLTVASGIYYWHVTTPDGRTQLGRLAVVN